jgi:glycosyltransferase involved in cell wall biosynthesis
LQPTPEVSIVLPTYNRADTIGRAVDSVLRQTCEDWELIVVDDGSSDGTAERLEGRDPRVRLLRQANQGVYAARNAGIALGRGRFVAFLDSDDEWRPHFLELTQAFFRASPADQFVTTEFLDDWGGREQLRQDVTEIATRYAPRARAIGSPLLELPAGVSDDYLRVYATREPLGDWGEAIAQRAGHAGAGLYRGRIFEAMRWGYLNWLPVLVVRREAVAALGPFPTRFRSAADYRFLALLAREYRANMISVPLAVRHNKGVGGAQLAEDHLASGPAEYRFALNKLAFFDELYRDPRRGDPEIERVRSFHLFAAGKSALGSGQRPEAIRLLRDARRAHPRRLEAWWLEALARVVPDHRLAARIHRTGTRLVVAGRALGPSRLSRLLRRRAERSAPAAGA